MIGVDKISAESELVQRNDFIKKLGDLRGRLEVRSLRDEIDKERLITEESIKERLQQLQLLLQDGELSEEEYEELETQLMERLRAVREYQRG